MSDARPIADGELEDLLAPLTPFPLLILAVSGGADSICLMHLVARWAKAHPDPGRRILVATIDHGLRPESCKEAAWVADAARALGLAHETLRWEGAKPKTGIQAAARSARYALLADLAWRCAAPGAAAIVTAHTEDDQAETFLMRLARGSGLDGLTGMSVSRLVAREARGHLLRPLLAVSGARLRATLVAHDLPWLEDPSNERTEFERVRVRKARAELAAIGLTNDKIALSARRLERARAALEASADALQAEVRLDLHAGAYASLDLARFRTAAEELRLRLLSRLISAFGGRAEPVRLAKLEQLVARLGSDAFKGATLGGTVVVPRRDTLCVFREPGRAGLPELTLEPNSFAVWDRRFRVGVAPGAGGLVAVRALGAQGFAQLRRELGGQAGLPPARAAATLPAFWRGSRLVAVPPLAHYPHAAWGRKGGLCSAEFLW